METEKTHYRKAFNSPYLSSADVVEPISLTVRHVRLEKDQTNKSKELFNTVYFVEKEIRHGEALKPMILNATNSRTMKDLAGSHFLDDWNNIPVTIYVDENVKFRGDVVDGLRISSIPPKTRGELTPENESRWQRAIEAFNRDGNLDAVLVHMDISEENQTLIKNQASAPNTEENQNAPDD